MWYTRAVLRRFPNEVMSTTCVRKNSSVVLNRLREKISAGDLVHDIAQEKAARKLGRLHNALSEYLQEPESSKLMTSNKTGEGNSCTETSFKKRLPKGLYIFGDVGTGKSMLMDTFYQELSRISVGQRNVCRRVHFHTFLADVHKMIYELKQKDLKEKGRNFHVDTSKENNPIVRVAELLADEVKVLCFDEFQVTDVADALILSQLFEVLFARGCVIVATSNRPPEDLYEGGINRGYFLPFIDMLKVYCNVHYMTNKIDYRLLSSEGAADNFFFVEKGDQLQETFECRAVLNKILDGVKSEEMCLSVGFNRQLKIKVADPKKRVCFFSFAELCKNELGASDYNAVARSFRAVIIEGIPKLTLKEHNEARRFITLIDELYEAQSVLSCSAVAPPHNLFEGHCKKGELDELVDSDSTELEPGETLGIDVAQSTGRTIGEFASVQELKFAFRRASSRLVEMTSTDWWGKYM